MEEGEGGEAGVFWGGHAGAGQWLTVKRSLPQPPRLGFRGY